MKKRKKRRIKPKAIIMLIIIILIIILLTTIINKTHKKDSLSNIGYSKTEIKEINTLTKENIEYIKKLDYISSLSNILKHPDFKEEYLEKYIELSSTTNIEIDNIIYVVNKNYEIKDTYTVAIMKEQYFIKENMDRYVTYLEKIKDDYDNIETLSKEVVTNVNSKIDYDFYTNVEETDTSKGTLMLVNKYHKLNATYVPSDLVTIDSKYGNTLQISKVAYDAFKKMWEAAKKEGLTIYVRSPYRSYTTQKGLYERYANVDGYDKADTYSARAGYSEHQTGLAIDIVANDNDLGNFENTEEFTWMKENAHKYGFILRYPKGKEYLTGYMYESWHYRYVGIDVATQIYNENITFEEYYAYYQK